MRKPILYMGRVMKKLISTSAMLQENLPYMWDGHEKIYFTHRPCHENTYLIHVMGHTRKPTSVMRKYFKHPLQIYHDL